MLDKFDYFLAARFMMITDKRKMYICFMCMFELKCIDLTMFMLNFIHFTLIKLFGMILASYRCFQAKQANLDNFAHCSEFGA